MVLFFSKKQKQNLKFFQEKKSCSLCEKLPRELKQRNLRSFSNIFKKIQKLRILKRTFPQKLRIYSIGFKLTALKKKKAFCDAFDNS